LFDPSSIRTLGGKAFKVFTPFSKACLGGPTPSEPIAAPQNLQGIAGLPSDRLEDWKLVPQTAKWTKGLAECWVPSEGTGNTRLENFLDDALDNYKAERDRPDLEGTSRLSPYLHFGQVSPHQVWYGVQGAAVAGGKNPQSVERYRLEILWREFSWHLLQQFPQLHRKPLVAGFENFPWREEPAGLMAWQKGMTGYPIVDAGMRQLWRTGWMHNRVRMVVASFLVKHLLVDWREGEAWFWNTLVDADPGSNSASWQWVAGCGADAAPFFRIFNPILQGQKFDPEGSYVKRYVPELAGLAAAFIHEPWKAPAAILEQAGIKLGASYPRPIVDHNGARQRALAAFGALKEPRPSDQSTAYLFA
ncbi:MAG: DNA photolyase family protein, partial [Pseudomonadota bacterium]|nr:DNA photolyase family protein [Pseudomonadota bacterium]